MHNWIYLCWRSERTMLLVIILMFVYTDATDCDATDEFTWENVSYSFFFDCSVTYDHAVDECNNTGMQILRLKTTKEVQHLSSVIVKQGYSPAVWVSGICPHIGTVPIMEALCVKFSANITDQVTRGYVVLTSECHDNLGWICESKTDVHPCPPAATPTTTSTTPTATTTPVPTLAPTNPTTPATTTLATTTPAATTPASPTTPATTTLAPTTPTTTPATTTPTTTQATTTPTTQATTITLALTTPATTTTTLAPTTPTTTPATTSTLAPLSPATTTAPATTPLSTTIPAAPPTAATTTTTAPATPAATDSPSYTSTVVHTACWEPQETRQGLNQYFIFGMCGQPISEAIHQCSVHNSSLAVLVSEDELQYLAARIGGRRNGSWSFWIGGLMQTGNCVIASFDQSVVANITERKFTISIGHNCHESHVFVCKTVTDFVHENLVLMRKQQGSVMDHRPTAVFLGSVGVAVMAAVFLVLVAIDIPNLVADMRRAKQNVKRFTTNSTKNAQPKDATKSTP